MGIAWLFPGQGAQSVGMGKALCEAFPAAREVFERADEALGWSLTRVCFEGPESDLMLTANTQPAILTTSIATLAALGSTWPDMPLPSYAAGHSLGEYSALVAAGALRFEDAVRLVHLRGKAMQQAVPEGQGSMAALMGADAALVETICREASAIGVVAPANHNAPGQVVISGEAAAVAHASKLASEHKLRAIALKVSAPFHCSLMLPAARAVEQALRAVCVQAPRFPVLSNVEAQPNSLAERVAALLVEQVCSPVLWEQSVRFMAESGVDRALEIGPGRVLAGLVKRTDGRIRVLSIGDPAGVEQARSAIA
ncbi:MAG: ACP S-malonyltransferase [Polyangiaceae bacterium]|nr:ACP S-malonyltransferase [Polyangiaceae bacterium]